MFSSHTQKKVVMWGDGFINCIVVITVKYSVPNHAVLFELTQCYTELYCNKTGERKERRNSGKIICTLEFYTLANYIYYLWGLNKENFSLAKLKKITFHVHFSQEATWNLTPKQHHKER